MENKVKVNILTGFFGSGKTTLLKNLIEMKEIKSKFAIIQKEFSEGPLISRNGDREGSFGG